MMGEQKPVDSKTICDRTITMVLANQNLTKRHV